MPTNELGSRLLARVGRTFVGDNRHGSSPQYGVSFYMPTGIFGEELCRIDVVSIPSRVVRGHRVENDWDHWKDDVSVTEMYAVWKLPGTNSNVTRVDACARYRDFGRLISAKDPFAVERAVTVISAAVAKAKSGAVDFKLTCRDERKPDHPAPCDGLAILSRVDPRDFAQVEQIETTKTDTGERHVDHVFMRQGSASGCGKNEVMRLELISEQVYGRHPIWEGDIQEINIGRSTIC
jgi:hypothetical protein